MQYYLVKFNDYWADEMDINSLAIIDETKKEKLFNQFRKYADKETNYYLFYFGTNEFNEYSFSDLQYCLSFFSITPEEMLVLKRYTADISSIAEQAIDVLMNDDEWELEEE